MRLVIETGSAGWDTGLVLAVLSAFFSFVTTVIAVHVWIVARNIRTLDWYRSQNDAWNAYNVQKLGPAADAFAIVDALVTGQEEYGSCGGTLIDTSTLDDPRVKAVLYQRMNILERDYKALALNLVDGADGHYLLNEIKANGVNVRPIINFMVKGGYDPDFVSFYRRAARWYVSNPSVMPRVIAAAIIHSVKKNRIYELSSDHSAVGASERL